MPDDTRCIVINTTPLITLAVATGSLDILRLLYDRVIVPYEVKQEILAAGNMAPGVAAFNAANWLELIFAPQVIPVFLQNSLDRG